MGALSPSVTGTNAPGIMATPNGRQIYLLGSDYQPGMTEIDTATGAFTLGYALSRSSQNLLTALTSASAALGADVTLNNTGTYFDGPSVSLGSGTWFVCGSVVLLDTVVAGKFYIKLWDGTTVISSGFLWVNNISFGGTSSISGIITNPAGNVRISVQDSTGTNGKILYNSSGNSKDSHITAVRIA